MKAAVFHKPKDIRVETVPDPVIKGPTDVILRVTNTSICGSDLHIYNGFLPQTRDLILGHEFMGVIEEVGSGVKKFKKGDRVIVPFPISCGTCYFCSRGLTAHCEKSNPDKYGPEGEMLEQKGGGIYGYTDLYGGYDGGQAEFVRVVFADANLRKVPDELGDEQVLFLTDILPTGWTSIAWTGMKPGETVAVFGCGPVGIMAQKSAWLFGAEKVIGLDMIPYRLEMAKKTANSETINTNEKDPVEAIRELTDGRGADVCVDAVGMEAHRDLLDKATGLVHFEGGSMEILEKSVSAVRRGGTVSVVGVYGTDFHDFPLGQIFDKGLTMRTGQSFVHKYVDELMGLIKDDKIRADDIITHRMPLDKAAEAYDIFLEKKDNCLKIVLRP